MRGLVNNSERFRNAEFNKEIKHFTKQFQENMILSKSTNANTATQHKEKLQKMQASLGPGQKAMLNAELKMLEKRQKERANLASQSQDRRRDWVTNTLNAIE